MSDEQVAILREAFSRLSYAMSTDVRDWSVDELDAWLYGLFLGWRPEAMDELVERFGWDPTTVERLRRYRTALRDLTD